MPVDVLGRAWIYDTGDPYEVEVWEHKLSPMNGTARSGGEWTHEHFCECYSGDDLRKLFNLPQDGNFQVLFKGKLDGCMTGGYPGEEEWDEWFDVEEVEYAPIPDEYLDLKLAE